MLAGDRRYSEVSVTNFQLQNFELYIYNKTLEDWSLVDCEQPLFFFRFSKRSARARAFSGEAARSEKRGRQPGKKKQSISFVVPLPSRAFSHARGHFYVSGVLVDGPRKKRG